MAATARRITGAAASTDDPTSTRSGAGDAALARPGTGWGVAGADLALRGGV